MSRPSKLRILVADDHFAVRMGLATSINAEPDMAVVAEAADGAEAIEKYREIDPDLVLMDVRLPGPDGIQTTAAICLEFPEARIIALTISVGEESRRRAINAGACACLAKATEREEILETIRAVARGEYRLPAELAPHRARLN